MLLSVSRRTDVPAWFTDWFFQRLKAGYALTRNPVNHHQITKVPLSPQTVDCIVFWTKNPAPMLPRLSQLDEMGYRYYFQFTLTPYGTDLEENLPPKEELLQTFRQLSRMLGPDRVLWRYDPVILNKTCTISWHKEQFERLCAALSGYTKRCTISFVDLYYKLNRVRDTQLLREIYPEEQDILAAAFAESGKKHGISLCTCCEERDLSAFGIPHGACVDKELVEQLCGAVLEVKRDKNQRTNCLCSQSIDLGAYNTCANGCLYCYASYSLRSLGLNMELHRPDGELLVGTVGEKDKVKELDARSNLVQQITLF